MVDHDISVYMISVLQMLTLLTALTFLTAWVILSYPAPFMVLMLFKRYKMNIENRRIVLAHRPQGEPVANNFRLETVNKPLPAQGEVLLRAVYLSLVPYMRGRMNDAK